MRRSISWLGCLLTISSAVACAPASDDAEVDDQAVTGGSAEVQSPVVYLFDDASKTATPKCAGTLIAEKLAITAKACAKEGLIIGRAEDDDGKGKKRAKVTKVEVPPVEGADIALVELDQGIGGTPAVITHAPLKDGYTIDGVASVNGRGILHPFGPKQGTASAVDARMISETETHGSILPKKGSQICAADIGAPACADQANELLGIDGKGTCGLAGIVIGAPEGEETPAEPAAKGSPADCSASPWKVALMGPYVKFLKERAPKAFEPIVKKKLFVLKSTWVADGLWGYESGGDVKSCKVNEAELGEVAPGAESKITATVSFENMQKRAAAYARVGIAPKGSPDKVRWLPTKTTKTGKGGAYDAAFEGVLKLDASGEYMVTFRASGNGGESWEVCGLDKPLVLKVALPVDPGGGTEPSGTTSTSGSGTPSESGAKPDEAPTSPKSTQQESSISDPSSSASSSSSSSEDEAASGDEEKEEEEETPATKKKKPASDSGGCSTTPRRSPAPALPALGLALGLAALIRRRRRA